MELGAETAIFDIRDSTRHESLTVSKSRQWELCGVPPIRWRRSLMRTNLETLLMMTRHNSDAILGPGVHFKATVALYPIYWLYNHVPGADFADLVDAPIRVGDADDYDGGGDACKQLLSELALRDAEHVSLRVLPGATHIFDSFTEAYEFPDPGANRQKGGIVHVRPDSEACEQARDDMTRFFIAAFKPQ
ncbi:MAG: uncharacterized protein QOF70_6484 [Acetobacteraceae bacterium]|jgi:uncharacterized protein|nr:uncharacterized protein [Acetobacteraceae bacterium]